MSPSLSSLVHVILTTVSLSVFVLLSTSYIAVADARTFRYAMVSGDSAYFEPIEEGWNDACEKLGPDVTCEHFNFRPDLIDEQNLTYVLEEHGSMCALFLRHLIERGDIDGIAATCTPRMGLGLVEDTTRTWIQEAKDVGIPAVVFDGPHEGPYLSYIGTNEFDVGQSMARLLKQLRPEGGTYVAIYHNGGGIERAKGFYEEIERDNGRPDKAHWVEEPSLNYAELGWDDGRDVHDITRDGLDSVIPDLETIASKNPTAILFMYQTPLRIEEFPDFVDRTREKNITFVSTVAVTVTVIVIVLHNILYHTVLYYTMICRVMSCHVFIYQTLRVTLRDDLTSSPTYLPCAFFFLFFFASIAWSGRQRKQLKAYFARVRGRTHRHKDLRYGLTRGGDAPYRCHRRLGCDSQ